MPYKTSRESQKAGGPRANRPRKRQAPKKRERTESSSSSTSAKKLRLNSSQSMETDAEKHYRIVDFLLVFSHISSLVKCVQCDGKIKFQSWKREGLGFNIKVTCDNCKEPRFVPSSRRIDSHSYEINTRFVFVMRVLGLGLIGCDKFCGLMDLSCSFMSRSTYNTKIKKMCSSIVDVAKRYFLTALKEEKEATSKVNNLEDTSELTVSGDGTWKERGFSSLYGVASLIGYYSGKVLDLCVKSLYCHECKTWENKLHSAEYEEWHKTHVEEGKCQANHIGASGNMEVDAIKQMFQRSTTHGIKYKNYIGDGDSKTYGGIVNSKPYGDDYIINKKECVGHVQKRMGTRLRDLVKNHVEEVVTKAGKKIKRKILGGKGNLTGKMIDKLTVYYGLAIRRNHESVEKMRTAIWATFFHYSSTDENPQHHKCPQGESSWCEWQKANATGELSAFKHSYTALPDNVLEAIKPIYEDLSKEELLKRCVGGFTQNNNESYNQLIWKISPKYLSGTSTLVEIAAHLAACTFNEGNYALLTIMEEIGIIIGTSACEWASAADDLRVNRADERTELQTRENRVLRRQQQQDALDIQSDSSSLYGPGIDDSV